MLAMVAHESVYTPHEIFQHLIFHSGIDDGDTGLCCDMTVQHVLNAANL